MWTQEKPYKLLVGVQSLLKQMNEVEQCIGDGSGIQKFNLFFFFFCSTGVGTQGLTLGGPFSLFTYLFIFMSFFKIGSCELFAWVGFKP
jgi:hypothetical protein